MASNFFTYLHSDSDSDSDLSDNESVYQNKKKENCNNNILQTPDHDFDSDAFIEQFYRNFNDIFPTYAELDSGLKSGLTWYDICFPHINDHLWVTISQKKHSNNKASRTSRRYNKYAH
jgi:hypothetical protein